jgi:hypothetical protein
MHRSGWAHRRGEFFAGVDEEIDACGSCGASRSLVVIDRTILGPSSQPLSARN